MESGPVLTMIFGVLGGLGIFLLGMKHLCQVNRKWKTPLAFPKQKEYK